MSNTPAYYRARVEAFALALAYENTLPESREQKQRVCYLRNGFVPDGFFDKELSRNFYYFGELANKAAILDSIEEFTEREQKKYSNDALTPLDLQTLDTWFALHPEKVCGVQKGGSGFSFPVKTIGTKQDIMDAIDATLNSGNKLTYGTKSNKVSMPNDDIDLKEELAITENIKKTITLYEEYFKTTTDSSLSSEYKQNKKMLASAKKQLAIQNEIILPYAEKLENNKPATQTLNKLQYFCCERFNSYNEPRKVLQPHGIKVILEGYENFDFFAHKGIYVSQNNNLIKDEKYWSITEVKTGVSLVTGKFQMTTKKAAIEASINQLNKNGGKDGLQKALDNPQNNICNNTDIETVEITTNAPSIKTVNSLKDLENNEIVFVENTPLIYSRLSNTFFTANSSRYPVNFKLSSLRKATAVDQEIVNKAIEQAVSKEYWSTHPQYKTNTSAFKYKFEPGEKAIYIPTDRVVKIIEPITAPVTELVESYSVKFDDGKHEYIYADDLKKLATFEPKKSNLTLYKYKAKAISIKLKLLQA